MLIFILAFIGHFSSWNCNVHTPSLWRAQILGNGHHEFSNERLQKILGIELVMDFISSDVKTTSSFLRTWRNRAEETDIRILRIIINAFLGI